MSAIRYNTGRRLAALAASGGLLLLASAPGFAQEACTGFKWPVDTEIGWMGAADSEAVATGATIPAPLAKALTLTLKPSKAETLPVVSGVKKQAVGSESFSGWFTIDKIEKAGTYQVSLSQNGWIDVAQDGKLVDSTAFTGNHECKSIRKSVRYELAPGSALIQIVGAPAETIKVTVREAN